MLRPEFGPRPPQPGVGDFDVPVLPQSGAGGRNAFAAMFGEIRHEVADFIENGSGVPPASMLSAEGQFYRSQLQAPAATTTGAASESASAGNNSNGDTEFLASIAPWANEASQRLGVSPHILSAHAALESGWGKRPLRGPDGGDTHNLFGVKAGKGWRGAAVDAATTEYENGIARNATERFRSFPDHASAFRDFTRLLLDNPRYRPALNTGSDAHAYAQGLVRGGYATDPAYAEKLARVAARIQPRE